MENNTNLIKAMAELFKGADTQFLRLVCQQCGWSEAKFYRKRRDLYPLSTEEREEIIRLGNKIIEEIVWKIEMLKGTR